MKTYNQDVILKKIIFFIFLLCISTALSAQSEKEANSPNPKDSTGISDTSKKLNRNTSDIDTLENIVQENEPKKKKRKKKKKEVELKIKNNIKNKPTDFFCEDLIRKDSLLRKELKYYMKVPVREIRIWIPVAAQPIDYYQGDCAKTIQSKEADLAKCYMELTSSKKRGNIIFYWKRSYDSESKGCILEDKWKYIGYEISIDPVIIKEGWGTPSSMFYEW